jgi:hypothetical protein
MSILNWEGVNRLLVRIEDMQFLFYLRILN